MWPDNCGNEHRYLSRNVDLIILPNILTHYPMFALNIWTFVSKSHQLYSCYWMKSLSRVFSHLLGCFFSTYNVNSDFFRSQVQLSKNGCGNLIEIEWRFFNVIFQWYVTFLTFKLIISNARTALNLNRFFHAKVVNRNLNLTLP